MSLRHSSGSRAERLASFVAAIAVTVVAGLVLMLAPGHGFLSAFKPRQATARSSDRVVYVAPRAIVERGAEIVRQRAGATRTASHSTVQSPATTGSDVVETNADTAAARPGSARVEPTMTLSAPPTTPRTAAGAPAAAATAGFTRLSEPIKFDSAVSAVNKRFKEGLAIGLLKPPRLTQDEIDAKLRAQALEAIVARGAGVPARQVMIGASIPVGLPGGGPSNKQRARDRAIFAELQKTVVLRQQKAESIATVRKRRIDSLAQLADSGRRRQNRN